MFENEALCAFCNVEGFHTGEEHASKSIEQAHIDADEHARTCDDEDCEWCDYDSSDVDYGDATPSA